MGVAGLMAATGFGYFMSLRQRMVLVRGAELTRMEYHGTFDNMAGPDAEEAEEATEPDPERQHFSPSSQRSSTACVGARWKYGTTTSPPSSVILEEM